MSDGVHDDDIEDRDSRPKSEEDSSHLPSPADRSSEPGLPTNTFDGNSPMTKVIIPTNSSTISSEEKDRMRREQPPVLLCSLIVNYPRASFFIGLGIYFIFFIISGILVLVNYDLFPTRFKEIHMELRSSPYTQRSKAWDSRGGIGKVRRIPFFFAFKGFQMHKGLGFEVLFETDSGNILTAEHLAQIRKIEEGITNLPNYTTYCRFAKRGGPCQKPGSILRFFEDKDPNFKNIPSVVFTAYNKSKNKVTLQTMLGVEGSVIKKDKVYSRVTRLFFPGGLPLPKDPSTELHDTDRVRKFQSEVVLPHLDEVAKNPGTGLKMFYTSKLFYDYLIEKQIMRDLALTGGSFAFIFTFLCIQTRSFWIASWTMFSILGSFMATNLIFRCIIQFEYFGIFHVLSIFIILGIGADDVFIFLDSWRDTGLYDYPSLEHRFSDAYRRAALAMAVTSITTTAAFLVCAYSPILIISSFGVFSAILVMLAYVSVITFLPTVVMLHHMHIASMCAKCSCRCCAPPNSHVAPIDAHKAPPGGKEESVGRVQRFFKGPFFRAITHKVGRWIILVVFLGIIVVCIVFAAQMRPDDKEIQIFKNSHVFVQADKRRFYSFLSSKNIERLHVTVVWGLMPQDVSSCKFLSDDTCKGKFVRDKTFNMNSAEAQLALLAFCKKLTTASKELRDQLSILTNPVTGKPEVNCFMIPFEEFLQENGLGFPLNETNVLPFMQNRPHIYGNERMPAGFDRYFEVMTMYWLTSGYKMTQTENYRIYNYALGDSKGDFTKRIPSHFPGFWGTEMRYMAVAIKTTLNQRVVGYPEGLAAAAAWDAFLAIEMKKFPGSANKAFALSSNWNLLVVQQALAQGAVQGIIIAISLAVLILTATTLNVIVALIASFVIACVTVSVIAIIVMSGWSLGLLESVNLTLVVGLSVDYVVHLAESYIHSSHTDRISRMQSALELVGISILSGAITTLGASFFMLFAQIVFFVQFGIFMFSTILCSVIFAMGLFSTFMALAGPENDIGNLRALCKRKQE